MRSPVLIICVVLTTVGLGVQAAEEECKMSGGGSPEVRQCMQTSCKAKKACSKAASDARAKSDTAAAGVGQKYGKDTGQSEPAKAIAGVQRGSSALYEKASADCDTEQKDKCEAQCKPEKGKTSADKQQIQKDLDDCKSDIKKTKDTLAAGKSDADSAAKGSDDTSKESKGEEKKNEEKKPEGGSPAGGGGDKKSDDKATTPTTASTSDSGSSSQSAASSGGAAPTPASTAAAASQANCGSDAGAMLSACQDSMKTSCANSTSTTCTQFTNRYCGLNGVTAGGEGADDVKAGSGAGDQFCKNVTAKSFCAGGARETCDSCRALKNLSPLPTDQQNSACGIDPASLPTLQKNGSANAIGAASAGGGGGSGGGGTGSATANQGTGKTAAVTENMFDKLKSAMGMDTGGGGGGGGGYGGSDSGGGGDSSLKDMLSAYNVIGRTPSSATGGQITEAAYRATDIQSHPGPNVFVIVTEVISARCAQQKENNCPPRP